MTTVNIMIMGDSGIRKTSYINKVCSIYTRGITLKGMTPLLVILELIYVNLTDKSCICTWYRIWRVVYYL
jgi:septin family protein